MKGVAKRYSGGDKHLQEDLEQEGFLGILDAQERFDASKRVKFSTYAFFWVKKRILAYLGKEFELQTSDLQERDLAQEVSQNKAEMAEAEDEQGFQLCVPQDMPKAEEAVLRLFFEQKLPLDKIALRLNLSREKVRQLKFKALRRLKAKAIDR